MSHKIDKRRLPKHAEAVGDAGDTTMRLSIQRICSVTDSLQRSAERRSLTARLLILLGLTLFAANAHAFCDSFHPVPELYVGDTNTASPTYDSACTQNDIQSAINAATCTYGTKIFVTREHTYTNQNLSISNKNVTLIGRGDTIKCGPVTIGVCDPVLGCPPAPTAPLVTISGTSGGSVFSIGGTSNVTLRYLDINNGNHAGGNGGGIDFEGTGSLTIDTSWVRANQANLGGAIYFGGVAGATSNELKLLPYTQILANTAGASGGGIAIAGNALLTITQPQILIEGNHADNGYGGGIAVFAGATANIGSPGAGVIKGNHAEYGGGIAAVAGSNDNEDVVLHLFTTDPSQPVAVVGNTATHSGGAIYLKPHTQAAPSIFNYALLYAWDYRIENNTAVEGAAIYADVDSSINQSLAGQVWLGNTLVAGGGFPTALGAVACTNSAVCNTINYNQTTDQTQGSIILIQDAGYLVANRFSMRGNHADHLIRIVGDNVRTELFNCLSAENTMQHELIYESGSDVPTIINSCTLANDVIGAAHVIHTESDLTLADSIIDEAGTLALDYSGNPANLVVNYVLSNDINTLPGSGTGIAVGVPTFVDPAGGDYHLKPISLGIDFAPTSSSYYVGNNTDYDGKIRNLDLPSAGNVFGAQDLGAYERQNLFRECGAADSIFCDGFDH